MKPVGMCVDCRKWRPMGVSDGVVGNWGLCSMTANGNAPIVVADMGGRKPAETRSDFGCTEWKPSEVPTVIDNNEFSAGTAAGYLGGAGEITTMVTEAGTGFLSCPKCGRVPDKSPSQELATMHWCRGCVADERLRAGIEDTKKHISVVRHLLAFVCGRLAERANEHDQSKLEFPEAEVFAEYGPKLRGSTYGSDEYKRCLAEMAPALEHHYRHNRHHPEHHGYLECNGCRQRYDMAYASGCLKCGNPQLKRLSDIGGMNLIDLLEMFVDWKAATLRHENGDLRKSIDVNAKRFGIDPQLVRILHNTVGMFAGITAATEFPDPSPQPERGVQP